MQVRGRMDLAPLAASPSCHQAADVTCGDRQVPPGTENLGRLAHVDVGIGQVFDGVPHAHDIDRLAHCQGGEIAGHRVEVQLLSRVRHGIG